MNVVKVYSVFDKKSKVYNTPQFLINDEVAIRNLYTIVADEDSMISKHPADYQLVRVGKFDMLTGKIEAEFDIVIEAINLKRIKGVKK